MAYTYRITATQPYTYLDGIGQAVNGFRVYFEILPIAEMHQVFVPNLQPEAVRSEIEKLVRNREALGNPPPRS